MTRRVEILIVDDRPENLLSMEELLRDEEIEVLTAGSGREALGMSLKHEFALVLLDVQMPEMDGFETAELMRGNPKTRNMPIIFVTAGEKSSRSVFKGYESGAVDYIYKPIDPPILRSKVRVFSELFRQRLALEEHERNLEAIVTERTRQLTLSEDRYRRLLASVSSYVYGVIFVDGQPVATEHGRGSEAVSGYTPEDYAADPGLWLRVVHEEDREAVCAFARRCIDEKTNQSIEHRIVHRDGSIRWIQNTQVPHLDIEGHVVSCDGVINDITRRRQAEEELSQALELASASNRAKSQFLANMSHEIRTPMTGIQGAIDLLQQEVLNEDQRQFLDMIALSSRNLLYLLDDILDLSMIEAGKLAIDNRCFSLRQTIEEVTAIQLLRMNEKGLAFRLDIPATVPDNIYGDPLRIKQVLINLLGNAIKFTERGTIALEVGATLQGPTQLLLQLAVRDTGIGIGQEELDRIFLPFEQGDGSSTRRYGGTGLGLSICQRLTDLMGGGIRVESSPGIGSTFLMSVPVGVDAARTAVPANSNSTTLRWDGPSLLVLVAEDSPTSQKVVCKLLEKLGIGVVTAQNGEEALAVLRREPAVGLVLMDVQMPVMDGIAALVHIREQEERSRSHLPVIAVTAHALSGDREKYLACGFDDYLSKPFVIGDLLACMHRGLASARQAEAGSVAISLNSGAGSC